MAQTQLLKGLRRFDSTQWRPQTASRCAGALAIILFGAMVLKEPGAGVLACLGALYAGLGSFSGPYPDRIKRMIGVSLALGTVTLIGSILSAHPLGRVLAVGVVAFVMSIVSTRGPVANTIAIQITAVMVVLSGIPSTAQNPFGNSVSVLVGGLIQTGMLLAVFPIWPHSQERRVVATAIETLSRFVGSAIKRENESSIPDGQPFQDAWALIDQAEKHGLTSERRYLKEELRIAEQIRAELVGLDRAYSALAASSAPMEAERAAMADLQRSLHGLSESIFSGTRPATSSVGRTAAVPPATRPSVVPAVGRTAAGPPATRPSVVPAVGKGDGEFWRWIAYLQAGITRAGSLSASEFAAEPRPDRVKGKKWKPRVPTTKALWSFISRHAGRYAVCVAAATVLSEVWKAPHSYWLPLTASLILRPDYATTLTRGVARIAGTLLGVLLAGVFALFVHHGGWIAPVELIVAGWLACALYLANYVLYATSITLYVIFSVSSSGIPHRSDALARMEVTLAGVLFCIAVSILWPIWESKRIRAVLKDALEAQVAYGRDVEAHVGGAVSEETVESRRHARALRIEAERIVNAGAIEPFWSRRHSHQLAHEFMAKVSENAAQLLALQAEAAETEPGALPGLQSRIEVALDEAHGLLDVASEVNLRP